ncbi:MAG: histidine kinase [Bacteroidota bacterium]
MTLKKPYRQVLVFLRDLLILCIIGNVLSIFTIPGEMWSLRIVLSNCLFSIGIGYPAWKGMAFWVLVLERRLPWLKFPIKRLVVQVLSLTIFTGLIIFFGFSIWVAVNENLNFHSVWISALPSLKVVYIFVFLTLLLGNAILFFKNWKEATIQQEELKRAHLALQYQSLKDQIRPHFLFNSLSSLLTLINTDTEKATEYVHKLSDVYRYLLDQRENELVPVSEELKFLEDYIYLQKIRFGENLCIKIKLGLDPRRMMIPLSLQMMVENAIKHNEISAGSPLLIDIFSTKNQELVVSNSKQKKELMEDSLGTGIKNLQTRMAFFTDEKLIIRDDADSFRVTIPTIPT